MKSKPALSLAFIVIALWLGITILGGNLQSGGDTTLDELVKAGPLWGVWTALTFLVIVTLASRWKGLGFARPDWAGAFRLMWLPGLFIVGMLGGAFTGTRPAGSVIFWIFVIEVGTPVTGRPPRRSRRAELPHRAPRMDAQPVRRQSLVWVFGLRSYRLGGGLQC